MSIDFLEGLSGGQKQKWLRENRGVVLAFMQDHSDVETMQHFRMSRYTYESFLAKGSKRPDDGMSRAERALLIAQNSNDRVVEVNHRLAKLERKLDMLTPAIKVIYGLSAVLKMAESLPELTGDFDSESDNRIRL